MHAGFILAVILFSVINQKKFDELSYVEVSFGLSENLVQTQQTNDKKQPEGEQIALKTKDALPQLTKNSAPKITQPQEKPNTEDAFKVKTAEIPKSNEVLKKQTNIKIENQKEGDLNMKDYLKRKEETLRKIGNVSQTGQKEIDKTKQKGTKHSVEDIPRSPFETIKAQNAPMNAAPTGVESGTNSQAVDAYKIYLRGRLKENWHFPDLSAFPTSLMTVISFTVNEFGYLAGTPKIVESSRNGEFDRLVLEAVIATFPVANPPPKEIHPPQTFLARYNSKDIK